MANIMTDIISPIDDVKEAQVVAETQRYIDKASQLFQRNFPQIPVLFDLKGRSAGMYRIRRSAGRRQWHIRYNPWLFAKYPDDSFCNTIPHEVAHYITDLLYDMNTIQPHGKEWKMIMERFGAEPVVRVNYDLSGTPQRKVRYYFYQCQCRDVKLTAHRHNKILRGQQRYFCRDCHRELRIRNDRSSTE